MWTLESAAERPHLIRTPWSYSARVVNLLSVVRPHIPECLQHGPFRGSHAVARGLLTRRQLRARCWKRLLHDVYVWTGVVVDGLTLIAAAALILPPDAVFSGVAAAYLYGVELGPLDTVEVSFPRTSGLRSRPGLRIRCRDVPADQRRSIRGYLATPPELTVADLARDFPLVEAGIYVEAFLRVRAVSLARVAALATRGPGAAKLRRVLELVNPRSESPMKLGSGCC